MTEPFSRITSVAVPLLRDNIDTDAIIPSREMRSVSKTGLAAGLFAGWRYVAIGSREPNPDFVLNDPAYAGANILVTGANFGCGSSREHAVWALREYGFRAIIAASFNPIFRGNCIANGILPVALGQACVAEVAESVAARADHVLTVDLIENRIAAPQGATWPFVINAEDRHALLHGLDPIEQTLRLMPQIGDFRARDQEKRPWIYRAVASDA